ncbi:MAG: hypothetical protein ABIN58_05980 [candidate division WOR-3 bacterium]
MKRVLWVIVSFAVCVLGCGGQTLRLTSPNGGESWEQGTSKLITWTYSGITGPFRLLLFRDGERVGVIARNLTGSSTTWRVGDYEGGIAAPGGGYKVRIRTEDNALVDSSDASFTITAPGGASLSKLPPKALQRKEDAVTLPPAALQKHEPVDLVLNRVYSDYMPGLCSLKAEVYCRQGHFSGPVVFSVDYGRHSGIPLKKITHNLTIGPTEKQTVDLQRVEPIVVWVDNPCARTVTVALDCDNLIVETNEENNRKTTDQAYFFPGNPRILPPIWIGRPPKEVRVQGQEVELSNFDFQEESGHRRHIYFEPSWANCGCSTLNCRIEVWQKGKWPNDHELTPRDQEHLVGEIELPLPPATPGRMGELSLYAFLEDSQIEIRLHCEGPQDGPDLSRFHFFIRMRR